MEPGAAITPMKKRIPNLLSLLRLGCAPVMLAVAWAGGSRIGFLALLAIMLLTDALDGFLAAGWGAESDLGRRLDSWGDYVGTVATVLGIWRLWPEVMRQEWPWFAMTVVGCLAIVAYGLILLGALSVITRGWRRRWRLSCLPRCLCCWRADRPGLFT